MLPSDGVSSIWAFLSVNKMIYANATLQQRCKSVTSVCGYTRSGNSQECHVTPEQLANNDKYAIV